MNRPQTFELIRRFYVDQRSLAQMNLSFHQDMLLTPFCGHDSSDGQAFFRRITENFRELR